MRIGALVTHAEIVSSPLVQERWSALSDASVLVGSPATRNAGTLGGNLANGSPAMDTGSPLLVFDGSVELTARPAGGRSVALGEFFEGPGEDARAGRTSSSRLSTLPPLPAGRAGSAYVRLEYRRAMEIAVVGAAALLSIDESGRIVEGRVALTAVAPVCLRVPEAEKLLADQPASADIIEQAAEAAAGAAQPDRRRARLGRLPARDGLGDHAACARACARPSGGGAMKYPATLTVNGIAYEVEVEAHRSLLSVVRTELGLTGSKEGCDDSECGACMMLLDGRPVNACSYLALQACGREITTVEGLGNGEELHPLQRLILEEGGVQCGFCTPGHAGLGQGTARREPAPYRGRR